MAAASMVAVAVGLAADTGMVAAVVGPAVAGTVVATMADIGVAAVGTAAAVGGGARLRLAPLSALRLLALQLTVLATSSKPFGTATNMSRSG